MATSRLGDKNDFSGSNITDGQANAWSDEMAEVHNSLGTWLARGIFHPGMFNLAAVPGQLKLDVGDGPDGFGAAVVGEAGNEQLVTQEGAVRIGVAEGLVASATNYVFLKQDGTYTVNQTGTRPASTEPVGSAVFGVADATSENNNPVGRRNFGQPLLVGPVANRPAAAREGRFWYDPSANALYYDTGAAWNVLYSSAAQVNDQLGTTYSLLASDNGKLIALNNAAAITLTVPSGLGVGFRCRILQKGAGQVTVSAGGGVTIHNRQTQTKTAGQYGVVELVAYVADTFVLFGDTGA